MNFKRSTTSLAIALMAVSLFSMASIQHDAFAQSLGMAITATADEGSDTITVTGKTVSDLTDVTFRVTSPMNNVVEIGQVSPDANGDFVAEFKISPKWTENGRYTITAMQGVGHNSLYTLKVYVDVNNGMAEKTFDTESNLATGDLAPPVNVARDAGLQLDDPSFVNGSDEFEVSGTTDRVSQHVTIRVIAPNGNVVTVDQITPTLDGEFSKIIKVGGPLWKENGFYTVTAQQFGDPEDVNTDIDAYIDSKQVDILDGTVVPEFGTIAAMILAVAIISIIAITARSRLSIMPRY